MTAQSDSEMSFAVLGPGGVGGLLGALLARQGNKVLCLSGEATAARLRESELTVRSERFGTFGVPVRVATELGEPVDACLITVKATNIDAAIERVPAAAGAGGREPLVQRPPAHPKRHVHRDPRPR